MSKILIVHYSFSGTTRNLAQEISNVTNGEMRELIPEKSYSFSYNTASKEVRNQIERGYTPKLIQGNEPIDSYDYIFIGSPNWFKSFAPPILSFLRSAKLEGKTIIPFCTHGGGGFGKIERNIEKECPRSKIPKGFASMGDFREEEIRKWIHEIGIPI